MTDDQLSLLGEQLKHALDLLQAELSGLRSEVRHQNELDRQRLSMLEQTGRDHETRIRAASEGVTQFKVWVGLASGSAGLAALTALLKSFLGG